MARPKEINIDVADESLTGFASNVTGATWTLATTATTDGLAHQVSIRNDTANDHSAKTAILTGTDADNKAQTETVNLPAGSATIESTRYFKTLTSVVPSATIGADTMDIGWVDEVAGRTYPLNYNAAVANTYCVDVTGTIDYTVQECFDDIQNLTSAQQNGDWFNVSALAAKTTDIAAAGVHGATAVRIIVNSYSSGAELQLKIVQGASC